MRAWREVHVKFLKPGERKHVEVFGDEVVRKEKSMRQSGVGRISLSGLQTCNGKLGCRLEILRWLSRFLGDIRWRSVRR